MIKTKSHYDVVIAGGGPVGVCLALALPDLNVAVIEARGQPQSLVPRANDRAIVISASSQRILKGLHVWPSLKPYCTPINRIHVSDQGHFGAVRMTASEENLPALGYVVRAGILQTVLHQVLAAKNNVDVFYHSTFEQAQGKAITIKSNQDISLNAELLVAADGTESRVRKQQNIVTKITRYRQYVLAATIDLARSHNHIAYERFTRHGPLALLPIGPKQVALIWTLPPEKAHKMMNESVETRLKMVQREFGYRLGRFVAMSDCASFPLMQQNATELVRQNLVLVGNAAHTMHPIAGQGLNLGLRDVAMLSEILLSADCSLGELPLLKRYQQARHSDQKQVTSITHNLVGVFSNAFWPLVISRNAGFVIMDLIKPIRRWLTKRTLGYAGQTSLLSAGISVEDIPHV